MPLIELSTISKSFNALPALSNISLSLHPGRIHGLLGENGAGKSTAMNILYGLLRPDSGVIRIDGREVHFRSPADAIAHGIGMVHQHFMLAGALSVLDNILLGDHRQGRILGRRQAADKIRDLSQRLNLPIDPAARVDDLSVGQQQRVEILKALYRDIDTLILDEPTAVLTPGEIDQLLSALAALREQGKSVIFISHKLTEVKRICDEIIILRRGEVVWNGHADATSATDLAHHMIGRHVVEIDVRRREEERHEGIEAQRHEGKAEDGATEKTSPTLPSCLDAFPFAGTPSCLFLQNLTAPGLSNINLEIGNEILGIVGVDGNGQQELAEVIIGLRAPTAGRILLAGRDITALNLPARSRLGIAHIPNDRKREGLIASMNLTDNLALKHHRQPPFSRLGLLTPSRARRAAGALAESFDIRAPSIDTPVSSLSGGNQQKVVLARELAVVPPKLIVAINPSRGLDIAATNFVYEQLLARRAAGCAILLISSELDELLRLSNRLAVLYRGQLTMTAFPEEGMEVIGPLMAGLPSP